MKKININAPRNMIIDRLDLSLSKARILVFFWLVLGLTVQASDHADPPRLLALGEAENASNVADFYAFPNPNDLSQIVFIITFDPFIAPGTIAQPFDEDVKYIIHVDNQAPSDPEDIRSRIAIKTSFKNGGVTVNGGSADVTAVFAGLIDDPFLQNDNAFGFGLDQNINELVLQVSLESIAESNGPMMFWVTTKNKTIGDGILDSAGNSGTFFFLVGVNLDEFNKTKPKKHVKKFGPQTAGLLPDVIRYDPADQSGYPNGRRLNEVLTPKFDFSENTPDIAIQDDFPFVNRPN